MLGFLTSPSESSSPISLLEKYSSAVATSSSSSEPKTLFFLGFLVFYFFGGIKMVTDLF